MYFLFERACEKYLALVYFFYLFDGPFTKSWLSIYLDDHFVHTSIYVDILCGGFKHNVVIKSTICNCFTDENKSRLAFGNNYCSDY